jgi:hypothetical protein
LIISGGEVNVALCHGLRWRCFQSVIAERLPAKDHGFPRLLVYLIALVELCLLACDLRELLPSCDPRYVNGSVMQLARSNDIHLLHLGQ